MARAASARVWVTTTSTRWVSVWTPLRAPVVASVAWAVPDMLDTTASAASARWSAARYV